MLLNIFLMYSSTGLESGEPLVTMALSFPLSGNVSRCLRLKVRSRKAWPSEQLMESDAEVADAAIEVAGLCESYACKAISDREGISEKIDKMGVHVEYVGTIISDYIKQGYVPMVW